MDNAIILTGHPFGVGDVSGAIILVIFCDSDGILPIEQLMKNSMIALVVESHVIPPSRVGAIRVPEDRHADRVPVPSGLAEKLHGWEIQLS